MIMIFSSFEKPPINTVTLPDVILPPCAHRSPWRAASLPSINTPDEPDVITSRKPPLQRHTSPNVAASSSSIQTVWQPEIILPPSCGTPPGVTIGQECLSPFRAAGLSKL